MTTEHDDDASGWGTAKTGRLESFAVVALIVGILALMALGWCARR